MIAFIIKVKLVGHIRQLLPDFKTEAPLEFSKPVAVAEVTRMMGLSGLYSTVLANGKRVDDQFILAQDCDLVFISPASGG